MSLAAVELGLEFLIAGSVLILKVYPSVMIEIYTRHDDTDVMTDEVQECDQQNRTNKTILRYLIDEDAAIETGARIHLSCGSIKYSVGRSVWSITRSVPICTILFHLTTTCHTDTECIHDDVIKWKHFPRNWPFVRGIHRSPVNSPHKGQWRGALVFSLICVWINDWVNNGEAGDLRRYRIHYDVTVM